MKISFFIVLNEWIQKVITVCQASFDIFAYFIWLSCQTCSNVDYKSLTMNHNTQSGLFSWKDLSYPSWGKANKITKFGRKCSYYVTYNSFVGMCLWILGPSRVSLGSVLARLCRERGAYQGTFTENRGSSLGIVWIRKPGPIIYFI